MGLFDDIKKSVTDFFGKAKRRAEKRAKDAVEEKAEDMIDSAADAVRDRAEDAIDSVRERACGTREAQDKAAQTADAAKPKENGKPAPQTAQAAEHTERVCSVCGKRIEGTDKFCLSCGGVVVDKTEDIVG